MRTIGAFQALHKCDGYPHTNFILSVVFACQLLFLIAPLVPRETVSSFVGIR